MYDSEDEDSYGTELDEEEKAKAEEGGDTSTDPASAPITDRSAKNSNVVAAPWSTYTDEIENHVNTTDSNWWTTKDKPIMKNEI